MIWTGAGKSLTGFEFCFEGNHGALVLLVPGFDHCCFELLFCSSSSETKSSKWPLPSPYWLQRNCHTGKQYFFRQACTIFWDKFEQKPVHKPQQIGQRKSNLLTTRNTSDSAVTRVQLVDDFIHSFWHARTFLSPHTSLEQGRLELPIWREKLMFTKVEVLTNIPFAASYKSFSTQFRRLVTSRNYIDLLTSKIT